LTPYGGWAICRHTPQLGLNFQQVLQGARRRRWGYELMLRDSFEKWWMKMTKVRMSIKLNSEIMKWLRQEAKSKRKSMASIVVGSMEDYKTAFEREEQLSADFKDINQAV
jgi:hypothetical protein